MRIYPAGDHELSAGIDNDIGFHIQRLPEGCYGLTIDENIRDVIVNSCYHAARSDQCLHRFISVWSVQCIRQLYGILGTSGGLSAREGEVCSTSATKSASDHWTCQVFAGMT